MKKKIIAMLFILCCFAIGGIYTAYAKEQLYQITDMWWDGDVAGWEEVEEAYRYEVKLFRGSVEVTTTKTSKETINFSSKMDKSGTYRFKVRALGKGEYTNGEWSAYSEGLELSSSDISDRKRAKEEANSNNAAAAGNGVTGMAGGPGVGGTETPAAQWIQEDTRWWYRNADGSYPAAQWMLINEKWYFFDETGYMKTGWIDWNNFTYYCGTDGAMLVGVHTIEAKQYFFDQSGALQP